MSISHPERWAVAVGIALVVSWVATYPAVASPPASAEVHDGSHAWEAQYGSAATGGAIELEPRDSGELQRFSFVPQPDGSYEIRTPFGLCLDVSGASKEPGTSVIEWPCHGASNQRFSVTEIAPGRFVVRARHSGLALGRGPSWTVVQTAATMAWDISSNVPGGEPPVTEPWGPWDDSPENPEFVSNR